MASLVLVVAASAPAGAASIAAGVSHSVVIRTTDSTVWSWGGNSSGQLGIGNTTQQKTPVQVATISGIVAVAAGSNFTLALKSDGKLYAWGQNNNGQCGNGNSTNQTSPVQILTGVSAIAAGENHAVALKSNGTLWTWGLNTYGQLGDGGTTSRNTPGEITGVGTIASVAAGGNHTLIVLTSGAMKSWGRNTNAQLGDGTTTQATNPTSVSVVADATAAAGGAAFSAARRSGGGAYAWGYNLWGQIGDGSTTQRSTAVSVSDGAGGSLGGVTQVAAGSGHVLAVTASGLLAWGYNGHGELGDGTTDNRSLPLAVPGLTSVAAVGAGQYHSLAVTGTGEVWTWGYNNSYQLGDGTTVTRLSPVKVAEAGFDWKAATPVLSLAAGTYTATQYLSVTITTATSGGAIRYTTDGSEPTTGSTLYSSAVQISQSATLKAKTFKTGLQASNTASAAYTVKVVTPTVSPAGGTYTTPKTVSLSTSTVSAAIRYTLDGSEPTDLSTLYAGSFTVGTTTTVKAKGFKANWQESAVASATYTMNFGTLAAPTISAGSGTYEGSVEVTLSAVAGATIRYTTNGADPTAGSTVYTAPLLVATSLTLKAKAFHPDYVTSATATATYEIQVAPPVISPSGGALGAGAAIGLATTTPQAEIRYTLDGSLPLATSPLLVGGSVTAGNFTLKAQAFKSGCTPSALASATFTVTGPLSAGGLAAGADHSLALRSDGLVLAWGRNTYGQIGDQSTSQRATPVLVAGLTGVVAVAAGANHSLALRVDGTVLGWGYNAFGQLGDGSTTQRTTPTLVPGLSGIVKIEASASSSYALRSDGVAFGWGANAYGQLGDGTTQGSSSPVTLANLPSASAMGGGSSHGFVVASGTSGVQSYGANTYGQLGNGTTTSSVAPVAVSNLTGVASMGSGHYHTLAVTTGGAAWAWGSNASSQLGDGTTTNRSTPVQVGTWTDVAAARGGRAHSFFLRSGLVFSTGANTNGQLGNGTTTGGGLAQVVSLPAVIAIASGDDHGLALTSDGSVFAWGKNDQAQIGDGTTVDRPTPVRVTEAGFQGKTGTPVLSPLAGTYAADQAVSLTSVSPGAVVRYTLDGTEPTETSALYAAPVAVGQSLTLQAKAWASGFAPSNVASGTYSMAVPAPTLVPWGGTYGTPQNVTATSSLAGTVLHYTTNGATPTEADPTLASGGTLAVNETTTLKVGAWRSGWTPSPVLSAAYTLVVATPTLSPAGGLYGTPQTVTIASTSPEVTLRYTTNGAEPTLTDLPLASGGSVPVSEGRTLKAKAWRAGWTTSATATESYSFGLAPAVAPSITPAGGAFTDAALVTLSSPTAGAVLRYTLDGSEPGSASALYAAPLQLTTSVTLKAKAFAAERPPSATTSATFTITAALVATPVLSVPSGSYTTARNVTITCATAGATIRYTTTGLDPTPADPSVASGASILLDRAAILKAKAWSGAAVSALARGDYLITGAADAGAAHVLALKADGSVWTFGDNSEGQLGDGTLTDRLSPGVVASLQGAVAVAAGHRHSLVLQPNGQVWSFGKNNEGQLGDGTTTRRTAPVLVSNLSDAVAIASGWNFSLALRANGQVVSFGGNATGQLGDGTTTQRTTPVTVLGLSDVVEIGAADGFAFAVTRSGDVYAWGANGTPGTLGDGTTTQRLTPVLLSAVPRVKALTTGRYHTFAARPLGLIPSTLWGWGRNTFGQLGTGNASGTAWPQSGMAGVALVGAGAEHTFAFRTDGSLWAFGRNGQGQIGDGSVQDRPTPVLANALDDLALLDGGESFSIAARADGRLWLWGSNADGQLGDGTQVSRSTPWLSGLVLAENAWLLGDLDEDGLSNAAEYRYGTDPLRADTNGNGVPDGLEAAAGREPAGHDTDGDGLSNDTEALLGTSPFSADSDGDGVGDAGDAFPLDPTRSTSVPDPNDHTAPTITLIEPTGATVIP